MNKKDNPTAPASTTNKDKNAPNLAGADAKAGGKVKPGKNSLMEIININIAFLTP